MTIADIGWMSPYTIKTVRVEKTSWWGRTVPGEYSVVFDDTELLTFEGPKDQLNKLIGMLNGAYNLGRSQMVIYAEFNDEEEQKRQA